MPHTLLLVEEPHVYALKEIRRLFQDYQRELGIDLCFQGFQEELDALPGKYAAPTGALFLLRVGNQPGGCVAIRPTDVAGTCELKRLYVAPEYRGTGLGRVLMEEALAKGRELGYDKMRLDTLARLEPANAMYAAYGFAKIPPYNPNPEPDVLYFERTL